MSDSEVERRLQAAFTARAEAVREESLGLTGAARAERRRTTVWRTAAPIVAALLLVVVLSGVFLRISPAPEPPPQQASLDGVAFQVPVHWTYRPLAEGIGCLSPPGASVVDGQCGSDGVQIKVGTFVGWPANSLDLDYGWSGAVRDCGAAGLPETGSGPAAERLVTSERRLVGDRAGDYRVWQVRCEGAPEFSAGRSAGVLPSTTNGG